MVFSCCILLLVIMAYGKNSVPTYRLNTAIGNILDEQELPPLTDLETLDDWYHWAKNSLLKSASNFPRINHGTVVSVYEFSVKLAWVSLAKISNEQKTVMKKH